MERSLKVPGYSVETQKNFFAIKVGIELCLAPSVMGEVYCFPRRN